MARGKISLAVLALAAGLATTPAKAQQGGRLGGGFLELLATGRDPTPRPWAQPQSAPPQAARPPEVHNAALTPGEARPARSDFARQEVAYDGPHEAGAVVIDTRKRFLFLVLGNGRALRYGVGVGRPGFEWAGVRHITRKAEWPGWTPPPEMLKRRPDLPRHMEGGVDNPLGARALYLGSTLYRIHGTNEPETIGHNVSSGCIRMMNEDVVDLYQRVQVGTKVVVI